MVDLQTAYDAIIQKFTNWAEAQPDIRAAQIIGSRARGEADPQWSDLDLEFYTTKPLYYRVNHAWIEAIAPVWGVGPDDRGDKHERRFSRLIAEWTLFTTLEGGLAVDFIILQSRLLLLRDWQRRLGHPLSAGQTGQILFDKDGRLSRVGGQFYIVSPAKQPTEEQFLWVVHEFWGAADRAVRKLGKGDLYEAKRIIDVGLKDRLVEMLDWHTRCQQGWNITTGQKGRHLESWADPRAVAALQNAYAHYDRADVKRALLATLDLFRWVALETAESLGYPYPSDMDGYIAQWITAHLPLIE